MRCFDLDIFILHWGHQNGLERPMFARWVLFYCAPRRIVSFTFDEEFFNASKLGARGRDGSAVNIQ